MVMPDSPRPGCRENNGVVIGDCSRMYLFGGYNGSTWLNDLWMFDIDTRCWTCMQESTTIATSTSAAAAGGRIGAGDGGRIGEALVGKEEQPRMWRENRHIDTVQLTVRGFAATRGRTGGQKRLAPRRLSKGKSRVEVVKSGAT